jgi:sigma-B regulation protein RsbU (phosphoserine phosphatase)
MSLERFLPRRLRTRFTLIAIASAGTIFVCTAPLTVWMSQQMLFERNIHEIQDRLDAIVSRGDSEMRAIRQETMALSDILESWDPKGIGDWRQLMAISLQRLPKAYGVRFAFEPGSEYGPSGVRSMYMRRGEKGRPELGVIGYLPEAPDSPGEAWYNPVKKHPRELNDGYWTSAFTPPESAGASIVTCVVPVTRFSDFKESVFEGVVAIDVTLESIAETLRKLDLTAEFQTFVIEPSRKVSVAALGGNNSATDEANFLEQVSADPSAFESFAQLQNPESPQGWFLAKNPYTGEKSCFLYQALQHNKSQLLYVIPLSVFESGVLLMASGGLLVGLLGIAGMGLLVRWSAGLVTRNLEVLCQGVKNVREGKLHEMLPPAVSHDETADVIDAFNGMVSELGKAFARAEGLARQQQRSATELDLARKIQQSALPGPIGLPGGNVFSLTVPAQEVGGDFFDHFLLPGGRIALAVGDISGKGVSAAMFAARASLMLRSSASVLAPQDAVSQVNAMLAKSNPEMMFVTLFFAVWDPVRQVLACVNAGHNPPFLLRADGTTERLSTRSGPALGAIRGSNYPAWEAPFHKGDILAIFTDGISEAPSPEGGMFGEDRLAVLLRERQTANLEALSRDVVEKVSSWQGGGERFDDITLLLARASVPPLSLVLPATTEGIEEVVKAIENCARAGGLSPGGAREIGLAACEAVTNLIMHSLQSDASRLFSVFAGCSEGEMTIRFEDDGPSFDPDELPPVDLHAPLASRPIGGLGWFLIRQATDSVRLDRVSDINILTLTRRIDRPTIGTKRKP